MWYAAIPCLWTIVVGTLVSFMSKPQDPKTLNPDLISPGLYQIFKPYPKIIRDFITDLGIGSKWVSLLSLIQWKTYISLFFLKFQTKDEKYHRIIGQQIKTSNDTQDTFAQHSNGLRNPGFEMSEKI